MMFCPYCGTKIQSRESSAESSGPEQVKGVIPLAMARNGGVEDGMFTLIVTESRLIIAKITEDDKNKIRKASGSFLLGGAVLEPERHRKALGVYSRRYLSMDPDAILGESEGNAVMNVTDVKGIRISSGEDNQGDQSYIVTFETLDGVKKYLIPTDRDSRDQLISMFGEKVHW
jgi:hypothetical protein